jgi:hypothetical protein
MITRRKPVRDQQRRLPCIWRNDGAVRLKHQHRTFHEPIETRVLNVATGAMVEDRLTHDGAMLKDADTERAGPERIEVGRVVRQRLVDARGATSRAG